MTERASSTAIQELAEEDVPNAVSRRNFIKGVITSGVAVSSAGYLFRASSLLHGQQSAAGVGERWVLAGGLDTFDWFSLNPRSVPS